jgi:hypothetical protein
VTAEYGSYSFSFFITAPALSKALQEGCHFHNALYLLEMHNRRPHEPELSTALNNKTSGAAI